MSQPTIEMNKPFEVVHQYTDSPTLLSAVGEPSETHTVTVTASSIESAYQTQCEEVHEHCNVFEVMELCPECDGSNLNEERTRCWDCTASDYQGGE